jgi:hypothetical protein
VSASERRVASHWAACSAAKARGKEGAAKAVNEVEEAAGKAAAGGAEERAAGRKTQSQPKGAAEKSTNEAGRTKNRRLNELRGGGELGRRDQERGRGPQRSIGPLRESNEGNQ